MELNNVAIAFGVTLFAGLATGIGSACAVCAHRTNTKFLCVSLGFSAGVMIYVSFVEIFAKARDILASRLGDSAGYQAAVAAFFSGVLFIAVIDRLIPSFGNPHEMHRVEEIDRADADADFRPLYRMGLFAAIAIAIHNFPEGMATFTATLSDPTIGIPIALAIAIHNIPEGIAVSIPIFYATGSRNKAFVYSFLSGLAEPLGAVIGYMLLMIFFSSLVMGILFAAVGGIMVFISLDELLPAAQKYGEHHLAVYGLIAGMAVMAVSLLLFL